MISSGRPRCTARDGHQFCAALIALLGRDRIALTLARMALRDETRASRQRPRTLLHQLTEKQAKLGLRRLDRRAACETAHGARALLLHSRRHSLLKINVRSVRVC